MKGINNQDKIPQKKNTTHNSYDSKHKGQFRLSVEMNFGFNLKKYYRLPDCPKRSCKSNWIRDEGRKTHRHAEIDNNWVKAIRDSAE